MLVLHSWQNQPFKAPHLRSSPCFSGLFDLVHIDVSGPIEAASVGGATYIITFIDDHNKSVVTYPLSVDSDAMYCFLHLEIIA